MCILLLLFDHEILGPFSLPKVFLEIICEVRHHQKSGQWKIAQITRLRQRKIAVAVSQSSIGPKCSGECGVGWVLLPCYISVVVQYMNVFIWRNPNYARHLEHRNKGITTEMQGGYQLGMQ